MAILKVHNDLDKEDYWQELMNREFDEIELLRQEHDCKVYRIQHEEITREDKQICFTAIQLADGIKPMIIRFDQ